MEMTEKEMLEALYKLEGENKKSIERHLEVKKEATELRTLLTDKLVKPVAVD